MRVCGAAAVAAAASTGSTASTVNRIRRRSRDIGRTVRALAHPGRLDGSPITCHGAVVATRILFAALGAGLLVVAWAAWHGGQPIPAIGAAVIALWMGSLAVGGLRRRSR